MICRCSSKNSSGLEATVYDVVVQTVAVWRQQYSIITIDVDGRFEPEKVLRHSPKEKIVTLR